MKTLIKRSLLSVIAVTLVSSFSQTVLAQDMSMTVTADNTINVYLSTDDNVLGANVLGPGTDWMVTDTSTPNLVAGVTNYIHVVAENAGLQAMFLGEFTLINTLFEFGNGTTSLLTNTTDWAVSSTDFTAPTYVVPSDLGPNDGTGTWAAGDFTAIDSAATFIWHPAGDGTTPAYFSAAIVPTVADLAVTVVENSPPIVVLPGSSDYTFTITNNGPADATNVVATLSFELIGGPLNASGPCVRTVSQGVEPTGVTAWAWDVGTIASGNTATIQEVCPIDSSSQEGTRTVRLTTTSLDQIDNVVGNDTAAEDTVFVRSATWDITKIWDGGEVAVQINCSDGYSDASSTSGGSASFTHTAFADGVNCVVTETVPPGFAPSYSADCDVTGILSGSVYSCAITNATSVARFQVTKDFSDGSTDDVEVTLTCNTGLPLEQSLTIAGGDPFGVIFVVTEYIDGTMSCSVTEVTNTPGYDMDTSGCVWDNVMTADSPFSCVVNNTARDGTFTVNKVWNIFNEETGSEVIEQAHVEIWCDAEITNGGSYDENSENWYLSDYLGDGESLTATVSTLTGTANCWANEQIFESGVESTGDCGSRPIVAGGSSSCTFTNTVFFEGIPTLSQYGLALLALLMLGVGMVGFRRFA